MIIYDYESNEPTPGILTVTVVTDGGPWAKHNMPCPVCAINVAIMNLNEGIFEPCWMCTRDGWQLRKKRWWNR